MSYEIVIGLDKEPYERILDAEAYVKSGSKGRFTGPPSKCYPPTAPTVNIRKLTFASDDPLTPDTKVPSDFFNEYEDTIIDSILEKTRRY